MSARRVLLVDLNNSARFPSLAIGYLVAGLRASGFEAEVLSPLAVGVAGYQRDEVDTWRSHVERRVFFSTHPAMLPLHDLAHGLWRHARARPRRRTVEATRAALERSRPDALLVSAYLENYASVRALGRLAADAGVPLVVGGPAFNLPGAAAQWLGIPGLTAVVAAEMDLGIGELVDAVVEGEDLARFPGVFLPDGRASGVAAPLAELGDLPVPDFTDFPWEKYASPVVPVMAGRGCSWGRCLFCSDVTSVNGRSFRTRPLDRILEELEVQASRHGCRDVFFVDIKLNSDPEVWRGIIDGYQDVLPGGRWAAMVHVGDEDDNGLSSADLRAARAAGMRRISFGLESGSQRVLRGMAKGTTLGRMSRFLEDASEAGLSTRATMMLGYPGETAEDLERTNAYLERHARELDRVRVSRFNPIQGTPFARLYEKAPQKVPGIPKIDWSSRMGTGTYRYRHAEARAYRRRKAELLRRIYEINRRELASEAGSFNGIL